MRESSYYFNAHFYFLFLPTCMFTTLKSILLKKYFEENYIFGKYSDKTRDIFLLLTK